MDAKKLQEGRTYEYVRKDGSVHLVMYMYPGVNFYMFRMKPGNAVLSMTHEMVQERVQEYENE